MLHLCYPSCNPRSVTEYISYFWQSEEHSVPAFLSLKQKCKDFNKQHIFNHKVETEISTQNKNAKRTGKPLEESLAHNKV